MKPEFTKGGRGKIAPYQTTHCRVPKPIKPLIDAIIELYKISLHEEDGGGFIKRVNTFINSQDRYWDNKLVNNYNNDKLVSIATTILKQKKSAKVSLEKLLTTILDKDIHL